LPARTHPRARIDRVLGHARCSKQSHRAPPPAGPGQAVDGEESDPPGMRVSSPPIIAGGTHGATPVRPAPTVFPSRPHHHHAISRSQAAAAGWLDS